MHYKPGNNKCPKGYQQDIGVNPVTGKEPIGKIGADGKQDHKEYGKKFFHYQD
jgi:hypothetical protein